MTVYVDTMQAEFGRMKMCHVIADSEDELHAMADKIGVARRWHQNTMSGSHYDIAMSKRRLAVAAGAVEITWRQAGAMCRRRRDEGVFGAPDEAEAWLVESIRRRALELATRDFA